jgi:hypothetical protein
MRKVVTVVLCIIKCSNICCDKRTRAHNRDKRIDNKIVCDDFCTIVNVFPKVFVSLPSKLYSEWHYGRNLVIIGALKDRRYLKRIISLTS